MSEFRLEWRSRPFAIDLKGFVEANAMYVRDLMVLANW